MFGRKEKPGPTPEDIEREKRLQEADTAMREAVYTGNLEEFMANLRRVPHWGILKPVEMLALTAHIAIAKLQKEVDELRKLVNEKED